MAELIEGLTDATASEYARLREELRIALAQSEYTLEQAASFADVSVGTLRNALNGTNAVGIDKLIRIMFVLGGRIEFVRPDGVGARPFQVVPLSSSVKAASTSSSRQSEAGRQSDSAKRTAKVTAKTASKQRRKSASRKRVTGWFRHHGDDVQKHSRVTREAA